ncbi:putative bifunctional diguanylate cyclase/phosphodiesterase [Leucobacter sp. W1478]|uniref:putative bifunctional diguanylate cyclase/phosphodiesterase n=1 Tax=Leucobacter sp. W1478 TaxID=3439065 RepID=UPI003F2C2389
MTATMREDVRLWSMQTEFARASHDALDVDALSREELVNALNRSRERFLGLIDDNPDMNYILDRLGAVIEMNHAGEQLLGYTKEELQAGGDFTQHMLEADIPAALVHFGRVLERNVEQFETRLVHRSGKILTFEVLARPMIEDGQVVGLFGIARDVTARREIERQLQESEQRYRSLFENNVDVVVTFDTEGKFLYLNSATERLLGVPSRDLVGKPFLPLIVPHRRTHTEREFTRVLEGQPVQYQSAIYNKRREVIDMHFSVIPIFHQGQITKVHCIGKDITKQKQLERKLNQLAFFDPLTGLPNRNSLDTNLSRQVGESREFAVLALDLDRLKVVNETWGRETGDRLLKIIAHRLRDFLPSRADFFRYSGDDFIVTYYYETDDECLSFARSLEARLRDPVVLGDVELSITSRIGISTFPDDGIDPDTLLRKADNAMFAARHNGRNRVAFYRDVKSKDESRQFQLEIALRSAIANDELSLAFHPQIDLATGEVHGVEALLRWLHPQYGQVPPDQFIPVAEESGLIHEIGMWVIEAACHQAVAWNDAGLGCLPVSVNISVHQFYDDDFADQLETVIRVSGIDPSRLVLEITETISSNSDVVVAQLHRFKRIGVRIAIDDFGTGYSSLRYLKDFPVDYLKIDRSFVDHLESNEKERRLVATITALAHNFGLQTIAEGTETAEQVAIMRDLGADHAQGYFFSRPLAPDAFVSWLAARA